MHLLRSHLLLASVLLAACEVATSSPPDVSAGADASPRDTVRQRALPPDTVDVQGVSSARARIEPVGSGRVEGTVTFVRVAGGVRVRADLTGLSQREYHAFQVLRGRDCGADLTVQLGADTNAPRGGPYSLPGHRRAGDLGNVRGDRGRGRYDRIDPVLSLSGTASAIGRAVVLRERRDDTVSPDGSAGAVIGCGIVEATG
ncbi:MAG: superoxide dismutase family protein [Bacteroidota bacterium]